MIQSEEQKHFIWHVRRSYVVELCYPDRSGEYVAWGLALVFGGIWQVFLFILNHLVMAFILSMLFGPSIFDFLNFIAYMLQQIIGGILDEVEEGNVVHGLDWTSAWPYLALINFLLSVATLL